MSSAAILAVLLTPALGFRAGRAPTAAPHRAALAPRLAPRPAAATTDYAERIDADRVVLRRAAETKQEESDTVVDALLGLEQACKERQRADATSGDAVAASLTGAWRLVFTTGTVTRQKKTGARVNYFPVKAVQTFDLEASRITNGVFLGDWAAVRFFGPMEFDAGNRKLTFDFTRIELFGGALGFDLGQGGAAEIGAATGLGSENNVKLAESGKKPFFNWIDYVIATARGGGGGLALWTRTEEP